ncbi:sortase [Candidatus Peregrinibacteria bacterium]|nr:sortase [Candidatus Peregrinibacteria bacterium]
MNKHRKIAYSLALIAIVVSCFVWTELVRYQVQARLLLNVALQQIQEGTEPRDVTPEVSEQPHVNSEHTMATHAAATDVSASVVTEVFPVPEVDPIQPPSSAAPADELAEWEIRRAWSISIPSLGIRAPVFLPSDKYWSARAWDLLEEQMQIGLGYGSVAYPHSASPGARGALIIAGHSSPPDNRSANSPYGKLFATLPEISDASEIVVKRGDDAFTYVVQSTEIVSAQTTSILAQDVNDGRLLKLITCYPVGTTTNRFVVTARLKQE